MNRLAFNIAILLLLSCMSMMAEVRLELKNGQVVVGDIIVDQQDVIVVRQSSDGARFQFPRSEVLSVSDVEVEVVEEASVSGPSSRRVSVQLSLTGGVSMLREAAKGGVLDARLSVGACDVMSRGIFFGGTVGYRQLWMNVSSVSQSMSFLPIEATVKVPLTQKQHSPFVSLAAGYAVALTSDRVYSGGLLADIDLGWKWHFADSKALMLFVNASFLQSRLVLDETADGIWYTGKTGRAVIDLGVGIAVEI